MVLFVIFAPKATYMKKILMAAALCCCGLLQAQDDKTGLDARRNEARVDLVSLIGLSKYNLSYERFLGERFSLGLTVNYANSKKINDDFDEGNRNTMPKYEIIPHVRYRFSQSKSSYYFGEIFVAANGGDFREIVRQTNGANAYYAIEKSDYFDMAVGGSAGYKMYIKERLAIELLVGFGVNTIDTDKSPDVFSRVGLGVGYRF